MTVVIVLRLAFGQNRGQQAVFRSADDDRVIAEVKKSAPTSWRARYSLNKLPSISMRKYGSDKAQRLALECCAYMISTLRRKTRHLNVQMRTSRLTPRQKGGLVYFASLRPR